jgi:hypothetical protein
MIKIKITIIIIIKIENRKNITKQKEIINNIEIKIKINTIIITIIIN